MSLFALAVAVAALVAAVMFVTWVAYTCGYDRGWADKEDGKPHRDDRQVPSDSPPPPVRPQAPPSSPPQPGVPTMDLNEGERWL